jgi:SPASM domain peptide maturase of grasp-with-spasm system
MSFFNNITYFVIYSCCIPVKGFSKSVIYDFGRQTHADIPNDLFHLLKYGINKKLCDIYSYYGKPNRRTIDNYFKFLLKNEYIFFCDKDEKKMFPTLSTNWDYPSKISNAIIDIAQQPLNKLNFLFDKLYEMGCYNYLIRFTKSSSSSRVKYVLDKILHKSIYSFTTFIPHRLLNDDLLTYIKNINKTMCVIIYDSPNNIQFKKVENLSIKFTMQNIDESLPKTHQPIFSLDTSHYTESLKYNTFFNRKVYIDINGNIKNIQYHPFVHGNIYIDSIEDIIRSKKFKAISLINKDKIAVCKVCEYRYMCTDYRLPKKKGNAYYYSTSCKYNPIKGKW